MSRIATGTLEQRDWEVSGSSAIGDGRRLSGFSGFDLYWGDIEGKATLHGIKVTRADGVGTFVSVQRLVCRLGDRFGSFVLELEGAFGLSGSLKASWRVVPGSGTGGLQGIRGNGGYVYGADENAYILTYDLD